MDSVSSTKTIDRGLVGLGGAPSDLTVVRWSRATLFLGLLMLAAAPLFVGDSYSIVEHTLSESGGQGVDGAWVLRTGVLLTAVGVSVMSTRAELLWGQRGTFWLQMYALGLVFLAVFPESAWYGGDYNEIVAGLHTVSGAFDAVSFILAVAAISASRTVAARNKVFDWIVIAAVGLTPQVMLVVDFDGLLQRLMVSLGYIWLIAQSIRVARHIKTSAASSSAPKSRLAGGPTLD